MKALELSGVHVKSMLHITWMNYNKNGTVRKNGRNQDWYVLPNGIQHRDDGTVIFTGVVWFTKRPVHRMRAGKRIWNVSNYVYTHPASVPFYADVEVIELP